MTCENCSYDKNGTITTLCGPCEEDAIRQRINWWQEGKRKLNEKKIKKSEKNYVQSSESMI